MEAAALEIMGQSGPNQPWLIFVMNDAVTNCPSYRSQQISMRNWSLKMSFLRFFSFFF